MTMFTCLFSYSQSYKLSYCLDLLGLSDVMKIVHLMSICASQKLSAGNSSDIFNPVLSRYDLSLIDDTGRFVDRVGSDFLRACRIMSADDMQGHLVTLSKAIGALVRDSLSSLRQLVQLCAQVSVMLCFICMIFFFYVAKCSLMLCILIILCIMCCVLTMSVNNLFLTVVCNCILYC